MVRQFIINAVLVWSAVCLTGQNSLHAATPNGSAIYRKDCARCHGKNGEGVKDKYDDALSGDWSLEKLTRYTARNMPEDDPGSLTPAQAEAVSRYMYDAFYSREARARNKPPRIELVRLTNRQYVNTVADLIKGFSDPDPQLGNDRGLRGNFRNRAVRRGEKDSLERIDGEVDFQYGASSPFAISTNTALLETIVRSTNGTNFTVVITNKPPEFNMNWRGSVIAQESGDYEFLVKTPNGARLWVNDDDKPLIDAGVASGDMTEHRATIRLLGGRAYPLRLEFFKAARDKTSSIALMWKPPHGEQEVIPARHLSPTRVSPTFVVTTPFPPDDSSVGYERGVSVSKGWHDATTQAAIQTANYVVKNLDRLSRSKASDTNRAVKVETFCTEFVTAAFRRPLTAAEKRTHVTEHLRDAGKLDEGVKRVVTLALKSPQFLYLGLERKADPFVVASRMSFGLWDSLPDAALRKAAAEGALNTREQIEAQARRMLKDPRAHAKVETFLHGWLHLDRVEDVTKDDKLFPGFTPEIIADLRTSLNLFLDEVVWSESSDYRRLLLDDTLWVNERLAKFYGISTNAGNEFIKVTTAPKERCGVITHPYLLAAFSYQKSTSPIHRGVFLTRNIVGRALKPPPVAVAFIESEFDPKLTMRQKVEQLTRGQACQSCHSVINPLGFSLEHYDAVGRFRLLDGDKPVDAVSEYVTDDGKAVRLKGARDVAEFAINSEHAQNGFVEQMFHAIVKQPILAYGPDVQEQLRQSWIQSGFNIQKLIVDVVAVSAMHGVTPAKRISGAEKDSVAPVQAATKGRTKS